MIAWIMDPWIRTKAPLFKGQRRKREKNNIKILTPGCAGWSALPQSPGVASLPHFSTTEPQRSQSLWDSAGRKRRRIRMRRKMRRRMRTRMRRKPSTTCFTDSTGTGMKSPSGFLLPYCYCWSRAVCPPAGPCHCPPCLVSPKVHPRYTTVISQDCQANLPWPMVGKKCLQRAPALP